MDQFKNEEEMLRELDDFLYKSKGIINNPLRIRLVQKINDFLFENNLFDTKGHDFVKHKNNKKEL